jgi:PAS domain S-box-containing protein
MRVLPMQLRMGALVLQAGIVGPLILALIVQTAGRLHQGRLQRYMIGLLVLILSWMLGMVVQEAADPSLDFAVTLLVLPPVCFMSPLFCLLMLLYARIGPFEEHRAARWAVIAPFWVFFIGFASNGWHGLMADAGATVRQVNMSEAGPLFWAFQAWSNSTAMVGLGVCVRIWWRDPSPSERSRATRLLLAAFAPMAAHLLFFYRVLPLEFPLTPAALGFTAILLVSAMHRYRLLDVPMVARRDVIEASDDAIVIANLEELVVDLNPAATAILGDSRETLCGRPLGEVLARLGPTEPPLDLEQTLVALRRNAPRSHVEIETGQARILELGSGCLRDAAGEGVGYFAVLRDRTAEHRAERLLHQSQKLESVGVLAAGVAHEVNNPLAFVRANIAQLQQLASLLEETREELPKEVASASEEMQEILDESLTGLDRMREIVKGLLRFSRTSSGRLEACDLNAIVEEAARFASLDRGSLVQLELRLADGLPQVDASPEQLAQVLLNLFLNAAHALGDRPGASIVATTRACGDGVEVRVVDNGPGVPEAIRERIFDPFFTTRAPNEGTGLGLAIAFDIVRKHGGNLELENPAAGGACFKLTLPSRVG